MEAVFDYFELLLGIALAVTGFIVGRMNEVRSYESLLDRARREAVLRMKAEARAYGHVSGADRFFLTAQRIVALGALAKQRGWRAEGEITPIPAAVRAEIERRRQAR